MLYENPQPQAMQLSLQVNVRDCFYWLSQLAQHKLYHCKLKQWKLLEKLHELCIATFLQSPSKWSRKLAAVHEIIFRLISSVKNLQQVLYYYYLVHSFFWFQKVTTNYIKPWQKKKDRMFVGMMTKWQMIISSLYQLADAKKTQYLPAVVSASQQTFSTKGHYYLLFKAKLKKTY